MGTYLEPPVYEVDFDGLKMTFKQLEYLRGIEVDLSNSHPDQYVLVENEDGDYTNSLNLLLKLYAIGYHHLVSTIVKVVTIERNKGNRILFFPHYNEN